MDEAMSEPRRLRAAYVPTTCRYVASGGCLLRTKNHSAPQKNRIFPQENRSSSTKFVLQRGRKQAIIDAPFRKQQWPPKPISSMPRPPRKVFRRVSVVGCCDFYFLARETQISTCCAAFSWPLFACRSILTSHALISIGPRRNVFQEMC